MHSLHDTSVPSSSNASGQAHDPSVSYLRNGRPVGSARNPPARPDVRWKGDATMIPGEGLPDLPDDLVPDGGWLGADREDDAWDEEGEGDAAAWTTEEGSLQGAGYLETGQTDGSGVAGWEGGGKHTGHHLEPTSTRLGSDGLEAGSPGAESKAAHHDGVDGLAAVPLCSRYSSSGICGRGDLCPLVHGSLCETCGRYALHPYCPEEAEQHKLECTRRHERLAARLRSSQVRGTSMLWTEQ